MNKDAADEEEGRNQDGRDAECMADPVHGMPMAGGVLRDPLLIGALAQYRGESYT
ncbi:MAG: hypothetical protein WAL56_22010 [Candidatus Sulfotelmatobacter sp.]